jgi:CMP-N-acetylneuraminic acid synthetase
MNPMERKCIAIIPARGGSKGIQKKNIRFLAGRPLIHYTILAAKESKYIHYIIVSTDDDEIANVSVSDGVIVLKRPEEISSDDSPTMDAILHTLEQCEFQDIHPEIVVLLQPTSPLRTSSDIDAALELFMHSECDSVISVVEAPHPPHWDMVIEGLYLKPVFNAQSLKMRRQDLPKAYSPNGAIYIASVATLKKNHSFDCPKTKPYIMAAEKSIDIDSEVDLFFADALIKRRIDHD